MGLAEGVAVIMLFSLIAYALLGGADFGGGVWDLLASGPRAERQRACIAHAIGPIWEANHVWLILCIVLLFAAFPPVYAEISVRLHIPLTLMLIGIVLRGTSFVFRSYDANPAARERWGQVFAVSSAVTPVLLGIVIGAITIPTRALAPDASFAERFVFPWLSPFPLAVGAFALVQFSFLAAVYLTVECEEEALAEDFRRRALGAALGLGVLAFGVLAAAAVWAPAVPVTLLAGRWAAPLQLGTGALAVVAIAGLWFRFYLAARLCAQLQVCGILLGWGLAMYPNLIAGSHTIRSAAAPDSVLLLLLIGLGVGAVLLLPALVYLLRIFKGGVLMSSAAGLEAGGTAGADGDAERGPE